MIIQTGLGDDERKSVEEKENVTDIDMRGNRRLAIAVGIIEFFRKEIERDRLFGKREQRALPARLENELQALSDLEFSSSLIIITTPAKIPLPS